MYAVQKLGERIKFQSLYADIIIEGCPIMELLQIAVHGAIWF